LNCDGRLNPNLKVSVTFSFIYPYNELLSSINQNLLELGMTNHSSADQAPKPSYPKTHLMAVAVCSAVMVLTLTLLPSPDATATKTVRLKPTIEQSNASAKARAQELMDESLAEEPLLAELEPATPVRNWMDQKVRSGDTLSHIFKRVGLSSRDVYEVMSGQGEVTLLKKIHPGQTMRFAIEEQKLVALEYVMSRTESLVIEQGSEGYVAEKHQKALVPYTSYAEGTIHSSLFLAAQKAGLSEGLTMELANIFGWDVDFVLDIREGDSFRVIYQEMHLEGEKVKDGEILAAQFTNQGETFTAIRYETADRGASYFTPDGDSMRKAFLRSPISFARISSHFNLRRKHPVLHTIRAHKGTDYAASRGTPIKATGDGKVVYAGRKGGYGKVVIIQHGQTYKTLYAHMNNYARGIRSGTRVKQGQVIGYVGSTGLATGPHLHYEFYVNGAVRNPVTVKLPHAEPIPKQDKSGFLAVAQQMVGQLATYAAAMESESVAQLDQ
jgi:murein DD-endopeptidase MepM/ murein hydrolase activator NlpD|tara:strand:- start:548 stop:2038 length:1491 start_codon:yes stop_codon:yes gene_type:complete